MTKRKILILNGHPYDKSFCNAIGEKYLEGAESNGFEAKLINLRDLVFDPVLHGGYTELMPLEEDLEEQQELINWCDHLVVVTPLWWGGIPALLKGYFDRVLLPGYAFNFLNSMGKVERLLEGRTARVIYTQGSPFLYTLLMNGDCFWKTLKSGTLSFCGFNPVKRTVFDNVANSTPQKREKWLKKAYQLGTIGE